MTSQRCLGQNSRVLCLCVCVCVGACVCAFLVFFVSCYLNPFPLFPAPPLSHTRSLSLSVSVSCLSLLPLLPFFLLLSLTLLVHKQRCTPIKRKKNQQQQQQQQKDRLNTRKRANHTPSFTPNKLYKSNKHTASA